MAKFKRIFKGKKREEPKPHRTYFSIEMGDTYHEFWDGQAETRAGAYYGVAGKPFGEEATDESMDAHGKPSAEIIAEKLNLTTSDVVLEVGVGVGRLAKFIAQLVMEFHGMDISRNMVDVARFRLADLDNVFLYAHQDSNLSIFPDNKFDAVYFQVVLIHLDRLDAFHYMRETLRVLKPGGRVYMQFYNVLHDGGLKEFVYSVDYMLEQKGKIPGRVRCYTSEEVKQLVKAAGFVMDEARSHLEPVEQDFDFDPPDDDWQFYLIAVANKPVQE